MTTFLGSFSFISALSLACLGPTATQAHSWQTVDVFDQSSATDFQQFGKAIAVDGADRLFAAGVSQNASSGFPTYAVVRRSLDHGTTWQTVDSSSGWYQVKGVAASPSGGVAIVGSSRDTSPGPYYWRVRLSRDGGATWSTVDEPRAYADYTEAAAAAFGPDEALYVAGSDLENWIVRRSTDLGVTWTEMAKVPNPDRLNAMKLTPGGVVLAGGFGVWQVLQSTNQLVDWTVQDDWFPSACPGTYMARSIAQDNSGNFIIVGGSPGGDNTTLNWVIRRSTDGGVNWVVADQLHFPLVNGIQYGWGATAVVRDFAGRMWATGSDDVGIRTRVSSDSGASWTDSDLFRYGGFPNLSARAESIACDSAGNLFVIGWINPWSPARPRWIVRKLDAPPRLSSGRSGGRLQFSWPTNASGYVLQFATTLTNGGNWQSMSPITTITNGQKVVTVNPTARAAFFRLCAP
jgi:hypothetical protein